MIAHLNLVETDGRKALKTQKYANSCSKNSTIRYGGWAGVLREKCTKHYSCMRLTILHVPVNLLGLPVATEQTAQDSHAPHPGQLLRHTGIGCTLPLTCEDGKGHVSVRRG